MILDRVHSYLYEANIMDQMLPWEMPASTDYRSDERAVKKKAIEEHLGVFADGSLVPLTFRQKFVFDSSLAKLEYKIKKLRAKSNEIVEKIEDFEHWEEDVKNTILIRYFILECLSPFKRYALEVINSKYNEYPILKTSWLVYISAWTFLSGILCFFMYWIFAWGVYENDNTVNLWGSVYGTGAARDILLVQVTKIFIMCYLPAQAMQHQLLQIRNVLRDVTLDHVNGHYATYEEESAADIGDIRVAQHMSAACRAARSPQLRNLPSAWLLRQVCRLLYVDDDETSLLFLFPQFIPSSFKAYQELDTTMLIFAPFWSQITAWHLI